MALKVSSRARHSAASCSADVCGRHFGQLPPAPKHLRENMTHVTNHLLNCGIRLGRLQVESHARVKGAQSDNGSPSQRITAQPLTPLTRKTRQLLHARDAVLSLQFAQTRLEA